MAAPARTSETCRLLIADDDNRFVETLTALLEADGRFEILGRASTGAEAVELARSLAPDVVLMDTEMPIMDGVEAIRRIRARQPALPVIVVSRSDYSERALEARQAGAHDYIRKSRLESDLARSILAAATATVKPERRALASAKALASLAPAGLIGARRAGTLRAL
jgi:DNA-binding NarL/FixJ family response regulator